jgi:copper(I)-binding protein
MESLLSMKPQPTTSRTAFAAACCLATLLFGAAAHAAGASSVSAENARVRWLPNNLPAAGYVTIENNGDKPVDLVKASSPDYGSVMLHQTVSNGSTSQMIMVDKATVPAHGVLNIAPGGYHFMLERAGHKIAPGDTVKLELQFSDGTTLDTPFKVKSPAEAE